MIFFKLTVLTLSLQAGKPLFFENLSVLVFVLFQTMITGRDDDIEFARMSNFPGKNYRCFRETLKQGFFSFLTAFNLCVVCVHIFSWWGFLEQ